MESYEIEGWSPSNEGRSKGYKVLDLVTNRILYVGPYELAADIAPAFTGERGHPHETVKTPGFVEIDANKLWQFYLNKDDEMPEPARLELGQIVSGFLITTPDVETEVFIETTQEAAEARESKLKGAGATEVFVMRGFVHLDDYGNQIFSRCAVPFLPYEETLETPTFNHPVNGYAILVADSNLQSAMTSGILSAKAICKHFKSISKYPNTVKIVKALLYLEPNCRQTWDPR